MSRVVCHYKKRRSPKQYSNTCSGVHFLRPHGLFTSFSYKYIYFTASIRSSISLISSSVNSVISMTVSMLFPFMSSFSAVFFPHAFLHGILINASSYFRHAFCLKHRLRALHISCIDYNHPHIGDFM